MTNTEDPRHLLHGLSIAALRVADAQIELENALRAYREMGGGRCDCG